MKKIISSIFIIITLTCAAQQQKINFTAPLMYPEGVAYSKATNLFYVSSVKTGSIGSVDFNGNYKVVYSDSTLKSSYGMKADDVNKKLWICVADANYSKFKTVATFKKMSRLIGIDLTTGKKITDINLDKLYAGKHFANDIAFDKMGNAYITDSYAPVIYKVANNKATVFAKSEWFKSVDVGLNGIVYHPSGYLLVAHQTDGAIYKVSVMDPARVTKVKMQMFLPGADGLLLDANNNLSVVVNKGINKVFKLISNDNWMTAEVTGATAAEALMQQPTTLTMAGSNLYVLNSKMDELTDSSRSPSRDFSLQLVQFLPVK